MSPSPEVLVTDHVFGDLEAERAALAEIGATLTEDREALGRAEALLVCFAPVPAAMIEAAERCRIIARYGIGVDNVAARGGVAAAADVRAGGWRVPQGAIHRLRGRRLALIGGGRIGQRVGERARAFGSRS